ncbi:hypothetical protein [Xenophilus azovorans]|uniref:hypothetical protein n=1 Tax=Xenophilus azovorans TaxID=151755 RepID=UPI0012ECEB8D|nr:hypothetical protein [Xenophilus azovorans]
MAESDRRVAAPAKKGGIDGVAIAAAVLVGIFSVVRFALFMVLLWLRMVVVPLCHALSGLMLMCLLFSLWAFSDKTEMLWGFGIVGLVALVIAWSYDGLLSLLSGEDILREL